MKTKTKTKKLKFRTWFMTLLWVLMIADISIGYTATRLINEIIPSPTVLVTHKKPVIKAVQPTGKGVIREVSAYNLGDPNQTDSSPCTGAHANLNLCDMVNAGKIVLASNAYPFHTKIMIEGVGVGEVLDRMNTRYHNRIDLAMKLSEHDRAIKFGVQRLYTYVVK